MSGRRVTQLESITPSRALAILLASIFLAPVGLRGQEGGVEVFAGETLFAQGTRVSLSHLYKTRRSVYRGDKRVTNHDDLELDEQFVVFGLDYGVLADLTVSALVPVVYRERGERREGGRREQRAGGLGDAALLVKYRPVRINWERSAVNIAFLTGAELPTGDADAKDDGVRVPPSVQPGSGSWDPFAAVSSTVSLDRWRFDLLALYKLNTEGRRDLERGDVIVVEGDAAYRFWYTKYPGPTAAVKLGVRWRHESRARQRRETLDDSGSQEILLRPGISLHPIPQMDISLTIDVPVYRYYNGTQLALDLRTVFAFGMRF